jgi:hypothetical protein
MALVQTTENAMNDNATKTATTTTAAANADAEIQTVLARVHRFTQRRHAHGFAQHAVKTLWVMLGDDERYWAATPADCARLERAGYEYAD